MPLSELNGELCVGVSFGTLSLLGLNNAVSDVLPTTAHFLSSEKCVQSCAFCAQAKSSVAPQVYLSRITWPQTEYRVLEEPLKKAISDGRVKRICIQTVENTQGTRNALEFLRRVRKTHQDIPISVCMAPFSLSRVRLFFQEGASRVGLPIDAASPEVYRDVKGGSFDRAWDILQKAASDFPGRISTHLICGLGETEEDMVSCLLRANSAGITVALFAFTPVRGTRLSHVNPPPVDRYRRIQLVSYILKRDGRNSRVVIENGRITAVKFSDRRVLDGIMKGEPFETSGCPDCNRPYYNERPKGPMMNFPRRLKEDEARECMREAGVSLVLERVDEAVHE